MLDRFEAFYGQALCDKRPFYNFGSGNWSHKYFQNIDIIHPKYPNNKPDIVYDAMSRAPLPIETGSAKLFYFSHVNEHLPDDINLLIFRETRRSLEDGGVARFTCPDFDLAKRAYEADDSSFFLYDQILDAKDREPRLGMPTAQLFLNFFATRAQAGSPSDGNKKYTSAEFASLVESEGAETAARIISQNMSLEAQKKAPGCHINWWNFDKFRSFLMEAGFSDVRQSSYLQSCVPPLRQKDFFDLRLPQVSIYVDAIA